MKSICFNCQFVGIGLSAARCPQCAFPLIVNTESAPVANRELEKLFERKKTAPPLPGVSAEPRQAQLIMARRRARLAAAAEAKRVEIAKSHGWNMTRSLVAASAVLAGLLVVLGAIGAL